MACDECASGLGNACEPRNVIVTPRQPFLRGSLSQRAIDGFGGKGGFGITRDEGNRSRELCDWNFREPRCCLLKGGIIHVASGDFAPMFAPPLAKMTLAIPNHERLWRWIRNAKVRFVSH